MRASKEKRAREDQSGQAGVKGTGEKAKGRKKRKRREPPDSLPSYLGWQALADYASCSKRWLQEHLPISLRFRLNGKVLVRVSEFDLWLERHREGQDLDRVLAEVLHGADSISR